MNADEIKYRLLRCFEHSDCWMEDHISTVRLRFRANQCKEGCPCFMHGALRTHDFYQVLEGGYLG